MPLIDVASWNVKVLARRWQLARPFPHVVLGGAIDDARCEELAHALAEEPAERAVSELYEMLATGEPMSQPLLVQLGAELGGSAMLHAMSEITGKSLVRAKARGYAYGPGHYLLPHADRDADALRQVAYALYVHVSDDLEGGELELFDCSMELGRITGTDPAGRIVPQAGTLVLFDVSDRSLHQVREVTRGLRVSLAGWFY